MVQVQYTIITNNTIRQLVRNHNDPIVEVDLLTPY